MSAPPDHSGNLVKVGGKMIRKLQTRWCELSGCCLRYYKARPRSSTEAPQGSIDLRETVCVLCPKEGPLAWAITGPHLKKQYVLIAPREADMQEWIVKIESGSLKPPVGEWGGGESDDDGASTVHGGTGTTITFPGMSDGIAMADFEVVRTLGKGAFGLVTCVRKRTSGQLFAMKTVDKAQIVRENLVEHVLSERNILLRVTHPFIVKLHYAFQTEESFVMVLDYLHGGDLAHLLSPDKAFPLEQARLYAAEIGLALAHLHSLNIVYRDLKPDNVILDADGHVKIADFGLAKTNVKADGAKTFCGTPEYVAPEIIAAAGHGKAVDWWSLGILLFRMLGNEVPFYSTNVNELYEFIMRQPIDFRPAANFPPEAIDLIRLLLDRNPSRRLQELPQFQAHKFFAGLDWALVAAKGITPRYIPPP